MTSICHVAVSNLDHLLSVVRIKERPTLPENLGKTTAQKRFMLYFSENCCNKILRAAVRKYRLGACKMKKSKIPKLCQNIALGKLFLEK